MANIVAFAWCRGHPISRPNLPNFHVKRAAKDTQHEQNFWLIVESWIVFTRRAAKICTSFRWFWLVFFRCCCWGFATWLSVHSVSLTQSSSMRNCLFWRDFFMLYIARIFLLWREALVVTFRRVYSMYPITNRHKYEAFQYKAIEIFIEIYLCWRRERYCGNDEQDKFRVSDMLKGVIVGDLRRVGRRQNEIIFVSRDTLIF